MAIESNQSEQEKVALIRQAIRESGDHWRRKVPILANTNLIGLSIFIASIMGVCVSAYFYLNGTINALVCILVVAILTSLLHELEHDLIHWQYFKNNKLIHHFMMLGVWIFRPGTINPWIRRHLHFLHHKTSGTEKDIEERGIGNGQAYTALRWWIMFDPVFGNIAKILLGNESRKAFRVARLLAAYFPFGIVAVSVWYLFLGYHLTSGVSHLLGASVAWSDTTLVLMSYINQAVVILIAPHYLRSFCLIFISSSMHYYGNVDSVLKQTQVLKHWYFWPLQLFCFNFGSTHGIHHFVVGEPFYIRQLSAKDAHKAMKAHGVPFNDLGTFKRRNRFPKVQTGNHKSEVFV
ncbi:hypothetical protein A3752_01160 [Oleiphilus sp. HI0081]|nr:hypothetical protein A3743_11200 [Oleiphilus sp. HI0072]KZZ21290.1 hypothetical protein A3752_01160 [Oleiphilus sp. HI0081]